MNESIEIITRVVGKEKGSSFILSHELANIYKLTFASAAVTVILVL